LTTKNSLSHLSGQVIYSDLAIDEVSSKNRIGVESKSKRATLVFMLKGQSQLFRLAENIGKDYDHIEYRKLLERLRAAQQVVVWIKSSDEQIHEPKIFQVDIDNKTYLDFVTVKYKNAWIFAFTMLVGLTSMTVVLYKEYPNKFNIF
jgi:GH43 family beta-xylosidase